MHLKKLFGGIHQVEFNKENTEIYSMVSSAKEFVKLNNSIVVDEVVENWLAILSNNMIQTLTDSLKDCLKEK
jgi:dynein heavy chain 2